MLSRTLYTVTQSETVEVVGFYIFHETKMNNQMNDRQTVKPNIIFKTIVREDPHRGILTLAACNNRSLLN